VIPGVGEEWQPHSSCGPDNTPCSLALKCPKDDACQAVGSGEGQLNSCGSITLITMDCSYFGEGKCLNGLCVVDGLPIQLNPPIVKQVKRYLNPETCVH
jgi:hypothetical protein